MSTGLKIFWWIIFTLIALAILGFIIWKVWGEKYFTRIWDNITFSKPVPERLDLQGVTLADLQNILTSGQSKTITLALGMDITNKNNFAIPFSAKIKSYYQGALLAETDTVSGTVPANGVYHVSAPVSIVLSGAQIQILIAKIQGQKVDIDYTIELSLFGIPLNRFGYIFKDIYQL